VVWQEAAGDRRPYADLVAQGLPMGPLGRITSYSSNSGLRSETIRNHAGTNRYAASACAEPLLTAADRP
jgi:hypothetical protein